MSQVVRQQAQREPHLVGAKPMAREASHLYGARLFLDPLLGRPPHVIEPYHRPARRLQVSHDETQPREQVPGMELHLRHYSPCCLSNSLPDIEKALVPHGRFVTRTPHRACYLEYWIQQNQLAIRAWQCVAQTCRSR